MINTNNSSDNRFARRNKTLLRQRQDYNIFFPLNASFLRSGVPSMFAFSSMGRVLDTTEVCADCKGPPWLTLRGVLAPTSFLCEVPFVGVSHPLVKSTNKTQQSMSWSQWNAFLPTYLESRLICTAEPCFNTFSHMNIKFQIQFCWGNLLANNIEKHACGGVCIAMCDCHFPSQTRYFNHLEPQQPRAKSNKLRR